METSPMTITNEMTVMRIPISQLRENPNNPRKAVTPESVEACAASMKVMGQETPIKVRKLGVRSDELGVTSPKNCEYGLIGGHIRFAAAKQLGWEWLNAIVLGMDDDQAELAAILDNQGKDMSWLDWDEAIERLVQKNPKQTRESLGNQLRLDPAEVSRAVIIMKALNEGTRKALHENFTAASENYRLSKSSPLHLSSA